MAAHTSVRLCAGSRTYGSLATIYSWSDGQVARHLNGYKGNLGNNNKHDRTSDTHTVSTSETPLIPESDEALPPEPSGPLLPDIGLRARCNHRSMDTDQPLLDLG